MRLPVPEVTIRLVCPPFLNRRWQFKIQNFECCSPISLSISLFLSFFIYVDDLFVIYTNDTISMKFFVGFFKYDGFEGHRFRSHGHRFLIRVFLVCDSLFLIHDWVFVFFIWGFSFYTFCNSPPSILSITLISCFSYYFSRSAVLPKILAQIEAFVYEWKLKRCTITSYLEP